MSDHIEMALPTTSCSQCWTNSFSKLLSLPTATNLPRALGDIIIPIITIVYTKYQELKQIISVAYISNNYKN